MAATFYPPAFAAITRWWGRDRVRAVNFDLPTTVEEYIDRQPIPSGARSGNTHTISFVTADEFDRLAQIEKRIGVAFTPVPENPNDIAP